MRYWLSWMTVVLVLTACGSSDSDSQNAQHETLAPAADAAPTFTQDWTAIDPGGDTTCSDGSPYRFFVRQGDPDQLLVYLQGGGACWFRQNCDLTMQPSYNPRVGDYQPGNTGIFAFAREDNPFRNHTVVMAPYCSADVHLGARDSIYPPVEDGQQPLTIHHQGRANMAAVLDWTYANVASPATIFVTGSSAGAIPSPFYAALIADQYPKARIAQLGDGAGGYRDEAGNTRPDQQWGTFEYLNNEPGFETVARATFNYEQLYIAAAKAHPAILFAEYDTAEDAVQKRFLALGGGAPESLFELLTANHNDIRAAVPNFRAFIAGGDTHTILQRPEFYTYAASGVAVRDWVSDLLAFKPVQDTRCEDCAQPGYVGPPMPEALQKMWAVWEDPAQQYVKPFQIFDNVYYVGIDWVAAYVIESSDGLILVDSLYGKWVPVMLRNMTQLGLDPADIRYVINTHGHFDHAGGSAFIQQRYGAQVVMTAQDWALAAAPADFAQFAMAVPRQDIVAADGDRITLGDTTIEMFKTPGHTEGVLSLRYKVRDGDAEHMAITLGGVGLNFSGAARTQAYLDSYARLQGLQQGVSVSLPNHAQMGKVFERAARLEKRAAGEPHPFVDEAAFTSDLKQFIANAEAKLAAEKNGTAVDPLQELSRVLDQE